jgi:Xaa-Pro dipeptidase
MAGKEVYEARAKRLFQEARKLKGGKDLDAIVIANGTEPVVDLMFFYLTGFPSGIFERSGVVVRPSGKMRIFTVPLEEESASSRKSELFVYSKRADLDEWLRRELKGASSVGLNGSEVSYAWAMDIKKHARAKLVDVSRAVQRVRVVKDAEELRRLREAARIASEAAAEIPNILRTGITEKEAAAQLEHEMSKRGSTQPSFSTICCFGKTSSEPHYSPQAVKLKPGMYTLFDFGGTTSRYCSDITRTFVYGKASKEQRAMYETVQESNQAGIDLMVEGTPAADVHKECARIIDATKWKGRFIHSTGHSLGLAVHDGMGIGLASDFELKRGMVFTCEPGIYVPGFGGVRIEDDVVIGARKAEVMTFASKELIEVSPRR